MRMMLDVSNVSFRYGKHKILEDIMLKIQPGEIVGLIGENGAGKSTLMKVICGLRKPDVGKIQCNCDRIGALIEEPAVYPQMTVEGNMEFFRKLYDTTRQEKEEIMNLTGVDKFPKEKAGRLSIGMKKRLGLAIALLSSDKFILLDEPTSGLDPSGTRDILALIQKLARERKIAFLISSHVFQDLEAVCDTYYRLKEKRLTNVYDRNDVWGYKLEKEGATVNQLVNILSEMECQYQIREKNVLVKKSDMTKKITDTLESQNIEWKRRTLSEVYFE